VHVTEVIALTQQGQGGASKVAEDKKFAERGRQVFSNQCGKYDAVTIQPRVFGNPGLGQISGLPRGAGRAKAGLPLRLGLVR
jgi:hypothetical protein